MGAAASGLALCLLGVVLLRRHIRQALRRRRWRRADARVVYVPGPAGPSWRFDFELPDGRQVSVPGNGIRSVAGREGQGPLPILYDPADPGRGVEVPVRPGLAALVGGGLVVLGLVQAFG